MLQGGTGIHPIKEILLKFGKAKILLKLKSTLDKVFLENRGEHFLEVAALGTQKLRVDPTQQQKILQGKSGEKVEPIGHFDMQK